MFQCFYFKDGRPLTAAFEDREDAEFFCRAVKGQLVQLEEGEYIEILDSAHS